MLELVHLHKALGQEIHIDNVSMTLEYGSLNILLGPTLSGKTSMMRLLAGLDKPSSGEILLNGKNVVGLPVQKRNVAMVYQQFINYPSLSVFENIASPLRIAKLDRKTVNTRVNEVAELLGLGPYLQRQPLQLSGGQQQRTALARALVKDAELVLLDEPLVNLDYKLREELRKELPRIFKNRKSIVVYATTEPTEALLLGGKTATLSEGRVTQFGDTLDVFYRPRDLVTAQRFSDPPLNLATVSKQGKQLNLGSVSIPLPDNASLLTDGEYLLGVRPHHLSLVQQSASSIKLVAPVTVSEITGSESFIHLDFAGQPWVALVPGIHSHVAAQAIAFYLDINQFFLFNSEGELVFAPVRKEGAAY